MYIPQASFLFIHWWNDVFRLIPHIDYCGTWECWYLLKILISILMDKYPEVGLLNDMVVLFLFFWGTFILLPIAVVPFCIPTSSIQGFQIFYILVNIFHLFFLMAILIGMMWYLIVTLVFISLMISDITLVIWLSSLKKYIFKSLDHFKIQVTSLLLSWRNSLCILEV